MLSRHYTKIVFFLLVVLIGFFLNSAEHSTSTSASAQQTITQQVPFFCMGNCPVIPQQPYTMPPCIQTQTLGAKNYRDVKAAEDIKKIVDTPLPEKQINTSQVAHERSLWDDATDIASSVTNTVNDAVGTTVSGVGNAVGDAVNVAGNAVGDAVSSLSYVTGADGLQTAGDAIGKASSTAGDAIGKASTTAGDTIKDDGGSGSGNDSNDSKPAQSAQTPNSTTDNSPSSFVQNQKDAITGGNSSTPSDQGSNATLNGTCTSDSQSPSNGSLVCQDGTWKGDADQSCTPGNGDCVTGDACFNSGSGGYCMSGAQQGATCDIGDNGTDTCAGTSHCDSSSNTCVGGDSNSTSDNNGDPTSHDPKTTSKKTKTTASDGAVKNTADASSTDIKNLIAAINSLVAALGNKSASGSATTAGGGGAAGAAGAGGAAAPKPTIIYANNVGTQYNPLGGTCNDKIDNNGNGLIDSQDPACHSDGNPANIYSYNPNASEGTGTTTGAMLTPAVYIPCPTLTLTPSPTLSVTPTPTMTITPTPTVTPTPTITPPAGGSTTTNNLTKNMTVTNITMSASADTGTKTLTSTITVNDQSSHNAINGVTINATMKSPSGVTTTLTGNTNAQGQANLITTSSEHGTFTLTITSLTYSGFTYQPTITTSTLDIQ